MQGHEQGQDIQGHDIVVVGFSAGGIQPLMQLVRDLPSDFPASLFVVHHFPPHSVSALPGIIQRAAHLPVATAGDRDSIAQGHIYVGRPDHHLLIMPGHIRLTRGPREHGNRPALDPLFRSAARSYGPRVIGVVLSGTLDDGASGLHAVKSAGGIAVVQHPRHAEYPGMPRSAIEHVAIDYVMPPEEIGSLLSRLVRQPTPTPPADAEKISLDGPVAVGTAPLRPLAPPNVERTAASLGADPGVEQTRDPRRELPW
jgi:two-component system chemotaxis response regulator CheB